jgi:ATP-dependent RNA helicase DeaD
LAFPSASPALDRALVARHYDEPTPVQTAVLAAPADRDLLVSAQTGSGKTVAYGLALGPTLLGAEELLPPAGAPLALVLAPTRELALQVERELTWLWAETGARIVPCVGGMDPRAERRRLDQGAHIVVGTPGRLRDHLERGGLDPSAIRAVVLDEADEMLDLGFREDLEAIVGATPVERRTLLFSATLPRPIVTLAERWQHSALRISVSGANRAHADIEYRAIRVGPKDVLAATVNLLRFHEAPASLVFANTREAVRHLQASLQERGFSVVALSGELGQHERNQALQALRDGRARVCVATDVAARGIDLPNLDLVIHVELPHDREVFQHRSGRTGRAGRKGVSCLLVETHRRRRAERLFDETGIQPEWSGPPTADEIRTLERARFLADPTLAEPAEEEDLELARLVLADRDPEAVAAALARLWRRSRPAVEEVVDPGSPEARAARRRAFDEGPAAEGGGVWFRANIGRRQNADPKWVLPMLCRRGGIERGEIGRIRIFDQETQFEVASRVAELFWTNARRPDEEAILIAPADGAPPPERRGPREERRAPRGPRPTGDRPAGDRPPRPPRSTHGESDGPRRPKRRRDRGPEA